MDKNLNKKKKKYYLYGGAIAAAVLLLGLVITTIVLMKQVNDTRLENEQLALENQQLNLANEYEQLNTEFQNYENQSKYLTNDSLVEKYAEAKDKVEKLLVELKTQKITSERRIRELQSEIATLKGIMRHYVEQIEALGRENAGLKAENQKLENLLANMFLPGMFSPCSERLPTIRALGCAACACNSLGMSAAKCCPSASRVMA